MLHITLTPLNFHAALVTICFTQLPGDAYSWCVKVQKKFDCTVSKICPFKRDFTALSFLGNSGAIFILSLYYCYNCHRCRICVGSGKRNNCENWHYVLMTIKYLNFYYPAKTVVVLIMHSSAQQGSWWPIQLSSIFHHFIESWHTNCRD